MPIEEQRPLAERVRRLAEFLTTTDAIRISIEREDEEIEIARAAGRVPAAQAAALPVDGVAAEPVAVKLDAIKADLVGIFHLGRPAPVEGELLDADRELAYVEALGIRNPVHSLGAGRIVTIAVGDGDPVEYGQSLFLLDRG